MKNLLILFLIFTWTICPGQDENEIQTPQLNHLLSPVETEVVFDFGEGLMQETRFRIDYGLILDYIFRLDTIIAAGTQELSLRIPLESPVNIRIRTGEQMDHLFVVPGQKILAGYYPMNENQEMVVVNAPESAKKIDEYYDKLFDQLQISSQRMSAYRAFNGFMDFKDQIAGYDSIAFIQNQILSDHTALLPAWFVDYEWKNIDYMTKTFTVWAINQRNYMDKKKSLNYMPQSLMSLNLNDTIALITPLYIRLFTSYAIIKYCDDECFKDGETSLYKRFNAILNLADKIENPEIRQVYIAQSLMSMYSTSQPFPDSLMESFEKQLTQPYIDQISKFNKSSIAGVDAPHFYLSNPDGESYTLKDLKGQVVLLNFWFVGCKPCEQELPHEKELVDELQNEDFKLVNICTNTSENAWKEFVEENEMPGLNLYAKGNWGSKLADSYQFSAFPTYVLIDKEGKIALGKAPRPSGEQLMEEIRKRL